MCVILPLEDDFEGGDYGPMATTLHEITGLGRGTTNSLLDWEYRNLHINFGLGSVFCCPAKDRSVY